MSPRPRFDAEQEFRLAVVMYGGVSLAIYINGVAQELYRLVKATAPEAPFRELEQEPPSERRVYFGDEAEPGGRAHLCGSERVYRELGQWLGLSGAKEPAPRDDGEPAPVRTRFVVDIISGTSAGGINGVFLAKAIAEQQDFGISADLWLEVADIDGLFRGKGSYDGIPERARRDPESLLNGDRLYCGALEALKKMVPGEEPADEFRPSFAEQLDLAVTATDLGGLPLPVRLGQDSYVMERVHRKVFRFEYGTPAAIGEERSDFGEDTHAMLAFAARATSSFPFAFEPVKLADVAPLDPAAYAALDPKPWFEGYTNHEAVYFADGGYLDNKPFSHATQALRRRRADLPVTRKLVYIEPDPTPDDGGPPAATRRPDVYANVADAMVRLPRFEPIRQDIADVTARNGAVARLRDIESEAEAGIEQGGDGAPNGPAAAAYRMLRRRTVLDRLAELAATLRGLEPEGKDAVAIRDKLRDWAKSSPDPLPCEKLDGLDAAFQQRRLSFLQDRVSDRLRDSTSQEEADELQRVKIALNEAFDDLRRAERAPVARDLAAVLDGEQRRRFARVRATALVAEDDLDEYAAAVADFLRRPLQRVKAGIEAALEAEAVPEPVREADRRFELYDMVVVPLAYPDLGEVNVVEIRRISPRDAPETVPREARGDPVSKLAGVQVKHFGAFLEASWRANDMLWGRLDAAEAIVDATLAGGDDALRKRFRTGAQAAILREQLETGELADTLRPKLQAPQTVANDEALVAAFCEAWTRPPELTKRRTEDLAGRAIAITGDVLAMHAGDHRIPRLPLRLLSPIGRAVIRVLGWRARLRAAVTRSRRG